MTKATISADGETIIVHIPLTFRKRGGRKRVLTPDGVEWTPRPRVDNAMVKALARAFRWRKMLDEGVYATLEDLARAKGVHATYVSRVLRLTLLAPEIVEAILDGRQPERLQLEDLLEAFPLDWDRQKWFSANGTVRESMISWHIEHGGRTIQLNQLEASEVREQINPIKDRIGLLLSGLEVEPDELKIVFVVDEIGNLSISLRGSPVMVNLARDQIGNERRLGDRLC